MNACTAGLFDGDSALAQDVEVMRRGHQERLGVMVAALFERAGVAPRDLGLIGVTLGPGSFTGLRVGLSFAKGIGAGLGIAPKGMGTLEALGFHPDLLKIERLAVIDGGRGQIYAQRVTLGGADEPVALNAESDFAPFAGVRMLTGPGAALLTPHLPQAGIFAQDYPAPAALNRLARADGHEDLTPLYMREADAVVSTRGVIAP
ncbi:MAG: tRNA (adenosine(37)-N6)-threonylcarbamoyltransferase complex dimerization subunit type 1 TsaB, partial [Asticcacaulis sp.]